MNESTSQGTITSVFKFLFGDIPLKDVLSHMKEFGIFLETNGDAILNAVVGFDQESASKQSELRKISSAREKLIDVVQDGYKFIDCVDDFLYYCHETTDFEVLKNDIASGSTQKLNLFLSKMKYWLDEIKLAYEIFVEKCYTVCSTLLKYAECYERYRARANANKKKVRLVGGTASAMMFIGGIAAVTVAGALTLGTGAVVGLCVTAAGLGVGGAGSTTLTVVSAHGHKKDEHFLKSRSSDIRVIADIGLRLTRKFDNFHSTFNRIEINHKFIDRYKNEEPYTLCIAIDNMRWLLEEQDYGTSIGACKDSLVTVKRKIMQQSKDWYN